ncbi:MULTISPECIES: aspartate carbamoyltransferase catalytic subunit [Candidatus Neomicrothrix]|uniref:Aspartate carbamoyltransferase n=1 Tax=Candidatus Neomicrothrix parvicella RN1 TaxID=1229780 RepID=R4Z707_9ACTN|nr:MULTISPECIES: aspartate carbamoyltransferase catalytic subunit [Microthrix]MBK7021357.1 aspartate carbamoyltransferase catalytic subunit [Candidatus Microthrix sp.]MBK7324370.1 aspartate carbamoyltransferase catalytic subunit [Candidatus Microthrix sp.]MBL0205009.1 aspartate carbamoyltransferase catalytic subunit [Candidatus Microthrix sp.]MBP6134802.1 aspartate carbamoyltransferase catalytic subunit [Candidatus Microthrix sp.]MBP7851282.1 aspartate carbamoyltransferase catalytic subunit [C
MTDLLDISSLGRSGIEELHALTDRMVEVSGRPIPKSPALRGRTVVSCFFEDSTRTRLSFEAAARRLSADVMGFSAGSSSMSKGESVRDTIETIDAMRVDAYVVRHRSSGVPHQISGWTDASVINAGDGQHGHPTQALLDTYTLTRRLDRSGAAALDGLSIVMVGDVRHSRVARSNIEAMTALGAEVTLVAPPTLLPPATDTFPVKVGHHLDAALADADVVYVLRIQRERMAEALIPTLREYTASYGLTARRLGMLAPSAHIMHPGPMVRGVEISPEAADDPRSLITAQVAAGVPTRMAVLFWALSGDQAATVAEDHS